MESIDFLFFFTFIIILTTAILVCFIYKCLQYYSNKWNDSYPRIILPLHEETELIKNNETISSHYQFDAGLKPTAPLERPTSFVEDSFATPLANNTENYQKLNTSRIFKPNNPFTTTDVPNGINNDMLNISSNKNSEISKLSLEQKKFLNNYQKIDKEEECLQKAAVKSKITPYSDEINECRILPLSTEFPVLENFEEVKESTHVKEINEAKQETLMPKINSKIDEIKTLFVAINLGTQKQAAEALTKLAEFTEDNKDDVIKAGAVTYFVKYLDRTKINLCKVAAQALANLSDGTNEEKQAIIDAKGIDPLIDCLTLSDFHIRATSTYTLANIINDKKFPNNYDKNLITTLIKFFELTHAEEHGYVTENNVSFFEYRLSVLTSALPLFIKLLNCNYFQVCKFAAESIFNFVDVKHGNENHNYELREVLIRSGVLPYFVQYLHSTDYKLCKLGVMPVTFISAGLIHQKQAVINANAVPALVQLLQTSVMEVCLEVTKTLSKLVAGTNEQKQVVIDAAACPLLVEVLRFADDEISMEALKALSSISAGNPKQQEAIFDAECISALIPFLNTNDLQKCNLAMVILFNIINKAPERNQVFIKHGGVPQLTKLLNSEDQIISFLGLRLLEDIASGNSKDKQAIVQAHTIDPLVKLLDTSKNNTYKIIMNTLVNIALGTSEQRNAIIHAGGIPHFCKVLQSSDTSMIKDIVKIFNFISTSPQKQAITDANALTSLVSLLKSSNNFIVENALLTLGNIANGDANEKEAIVKTTGAIPMIVYLMHSSNLLICEQAVGIIANLSNGTQTHKKAIIDALVVPTVIQLFDSTDINIRKNALNILERLIDGINQDVIDGYEITALQKLLENRENIISGNSDISHIVTAERKAKFPTPTVHHPSIVKTIHAPVVIEIGSRWTKYGLGGELIPRKFTSSLIKNPSNGKIVHVLEQTLPYKDLYNGLNKLFKRILVKDLLNSTSRAEFFDFKDRYRWNDRVEQKRRVVIIESLFTPPEIRRLIANVLFDEHSFKIQSVQYVPAPLMNLLPFGTTTSLVVDIGNYSTTVFPVTDYIILFDAHEKNCAGGGAITTRISEYLMAKGKIKDHDGSLRDFTDDEKEEFQQLKISEDICARFIMVTRMDRARIIHTMEDNIFLQFATDVEIPFRTRKIILPGLLREAAAECLFKKEDGFTPIPELIFRSLIKVPINSHRLLLNNILITGSAAGLPGMLGRIKVELIELLKNEFPEMIDEVKFLKLPHYNGVERYSSWLGGSIFADVDELSHGIYTREDWISKKSLPDWTNIG